MLIPSKHSGYQAGVRLYPGKSSPPPAPDYRAAAVETAAGNKEMAEYATKANRIDQFNPYGSLTYNQDPTGKWSQTMNLTPQAQATLDKQIKLSDQYADAASAGFGNIKGLMENPNIDTSGMPQYTGIDQSKLAAAPVNAGMTAQEAIMSRLNPSLQGEDEALRTRLANQGISLGSNAYGRELGLQGQRGNDLRLQAAAQGIGIDQAARQQGFNEQMSMAGLNASQRQAMLNEAYTKQSRPLDLVNSLRTGAQVQNPTFQPYAQQQTVPGADFLGATNQQYGQQMNAYNAQQAGQDKMMGGLMNLGSSAITAGLF